MRRLSAIAFLLSMIYIAVSGTSFVYAAPDTPDPTPEPTATPEEKRSKFSLPSITYVLDPSAALRDLVKDIIAGIFTDIAQFSARSSNTAWNAFVNQLRSPQKPGRYEQIGKIIQGTAGALFIPLAILRLVWFHQHRLTGAGDSLIGVIVEWIGVGLAVAYLPRLIDWSWEFSHRMAGSVLAAVGAVNSPGSLLMVDVSSSLAWPFFLFIAGILLIGVVYGLVASYWAAQAASFMFAALAPLLIVFTLLPPFRFVRRIIAILYLTLLIMPVVTALALVGLAWLPLNIGGPPFLGLFIRIIWLATSIGLLLKIAGTLSSVGLDAAKGLATATVRAAIATITGLASAGALGGAIAAAGGISSLGGVTKTALPGVQTSSGSGNASTDGASTGTASQNTPSPGTSSPDYTRAAHLAEVAGILGGSGIMGRAGRALGRYYRSLASSASPASPLSSDTPAPHQVGFAVARQLGMAGGYTSYVRTLQKVTDLLASESPQVQPLLWSQYNDEEKAPLAGAVAAFYSQSPEQFQTILKKEGWEGIHREAQELLRGSHG